ncbi:energy-coupling factor transporter transmembrane component T [Cohnella nanjingensis]|uniref:Energy-coupling factor transporter transmembrane protein EcfT n=1 Tax=Cohnella nanjingensis TaxID=1387779 RepID=A0A7X0VE37_9BACL|nr:energy-coupling factor transporter transmembrane component T [Cohnella nanjingensis]MBB6670316.1 energy-coupling factor transporter transmembrane protein EcfT [Cohnella nanjingensis]
MREGFGFRSLHPIVAIVYYAGGMTFGMLLFHPAVLLAGWLGAVLANVALDRAASLRRWAVPMLSGIVIVMIVNPLISHRGRTVLTYLGDMPITLESVAYGATMAIMLLNVLTLFVTYRLVLTEQKFLYLFARLLPKTALVAMMATGLIPRLRRRLGDLTLVQRTRGITVTEGGLAHRARSGARLLHSLLAWSLEDALQTADSMQARGYGTGERSAYVSYRFRARDGIALAALAAAGSALLTGWAYGYGLLAVYPRLETLALSGGDRLVAAVYFIYIVLPLGWEWRDRSAWRASNWSR